MTHLASPDFALSTVEPEDVLAAIVDKLAEIEAGRVSDEELDTSPEGRAWLLACDRADYERGLDD